jgi:2-amino-4-hydroxy-6-hydroxymethyldihydropteridine diphosphokinase
MTRTALVALGANLPGPAGPPRATVAAALEALAALGSLRPGRLWRSPAWPPGGPPYVNACAALETDLAPEALLARLHAIEAAHGRERAVRWGARTLDLDLLALDALVLPDDATQDAWRGLSPEAQGREAPARLILPHPRLQDRGFVLLPLMDVAPGWRHPRTGLTVRQMRAALPEAAVAGVEPLDGPALSPPA